VQEHDPDFGFFWALDDAIMVGQSTVPRMTLATADAVHARVDRLLAARRDEVQRMGGLMILHDWRSLEAYDREARQRFIDKSRSRGRGYLRASIVAVRASPLIRMALQTGNMLLSVFLGVSIEVIDDPTSKVRALGLVAPAPGATFPA